MVAKQNCMKLTTVITGASHFLARQISTQPNTQCQKLQSIKLPSCPSQKQLNKYSTCNALLLCCQAYLYSNKWFEIMKYSDAKMAITEIVSAKNAIRASLIQLFFLSRSVVFVALKKAMVANKLATKESIAKKCPSCPGSKSSPINSIAII